MNKFLGGLLVITLIGGASVFKVDYIAYEFYRTNAAIINYLKKDDAYILLNKEEDEEIVNGLMEEIDYGKRRINELKKEKNTIFETLENTLQFKAKNKESLSEEFVAEFQSFNKAYIKERTDVEPELDNILNKNYLDIQKEILHKDTDYEYILAEFRDIVKKQNKIIEFLENIVNLGQKTLMLCA